MQLFFNKEEKFHIESIAAKRDNLVLQDQLLERELNAVIADFCKRNSVDATKAKSLDYQKGCIEFEDEKKTAGKKKAKE